MKNKEYGKAVIMMATYNGGEYLEEQLASLQKQTFTDWDLYVSDDGSSDKTIEILQNFQKKDARLKKIINNSNNHGAFNNYFNIMYYLRKQKKYDYYFFCDQDDIWIKNKMQLQINILKKYDEPYLCYSDLEFIDEKGQDEKKSMSELTDINLINPYNIFFSYRYIWGTTLAFNKKLWEKVHIEPNKGLNISHDNYIGKYAAIFGKIQYINKCLVLYRRHGDNVSDIPGKYNFKGMIKRATVGLSKVIACHAQTYWDDLYFLRHCAVENEFLDDLTKCIQNGGITAIKVLKKYNIKTSNKRLSQLSIKVILFFKLYKLTSIFKKKEYI